MTPQQRDLSRLLVSKMPHNANNDGTFHVLA
jgi:hypothetical protein